MNTTTLNMTTLDGGVIIKKGTAPAPPSGGGGADLEGEYFLAKPNGRYWKFSFSPPPSNSYVDPKSLSAEQLEALMMFCEMFAPFSVIYGAAVCYAGVALNEFLRVDGVGFASARLGTMIVILEQTNSDDYSNIEYPFNSSFFRVWKECSVKTSTITEIVPFHEYDVVSLIKQMASMDGEEITDDDAKAMLQEIFMLIPATEEEYKAARREN